MILWTLVYAKTAEMLSPSGHRPASSRDVVETKDFFDKVFLLHKPDVGG